MKLRYQLFLLVGSLFLLCYVVAVSVQAYVTRRSIRKAEHGMVEQIEKIYREKQLRIQDFLYSTVAEKISEIETLELVIASYPPQMEGFLNPDTSWENLSEVFYANKWLDFLQQSNGGSTIVVDQRALEPVDIGAEAENGDLIKVSFQGKEWIGIALPFQILANELIQQQKEPLKAYLLFSSEQIVALKTSPLNLEEVKDWAQLVKKIEDLLQKAALNPSWQEVAPPAASSPSVNEETKIFEEHRKKWVERSDQSVMIRLLSKMATLELFGKTPSSPNFPEAIAVFSDQHSSGYSLLTSKAFLQDVKIEPSVTEALAKDFLFPPLVFAVEDTLFMGSSLPIDSGNLTLGVSLRDIAQDLSSELDMPFFCAFNGKIFLQGTKWDALLKDFPLEKLGKESSGTIEMNGNSVFFMKIAPIPGIDLQFLGVNYAKREFAFLHSFEAGTRQVLKEISEKMWLVALAAIALALLFLNRIAKRTTEPVAKLAAAAEAVGKGKLAEVALPKMRLNRNDEIHSLYASFDEMVQSLKDKEKVRAALNKVVSPVIASEILKSEMRLGGEKKRVCIWFADIRGFTKMTESMEPEHVIVMLNHCMTRVSSVIDENKGIIDKYVGDEVMGLCGMPHLKEDDALRAVQAAVSVHKLLEEWNRQREAEGKKAILMGIGIDVGEVVAGNMGAIDRQNYTVLGRHVNIASRLCSVAAPKQILITEAIASSPRVKEHYQIREVGKESLKGFTEPITIYEVIFQ